MHVGIGFKSGYPEISPSTRDFDDQKMWTFYQASESARIHSSIFKSGDTVIYKHRASAFAGNVLQMVLRSQRLKNLVLFGIATVA